MARVAVLDANVLWPQSLRDALIRAARSDLYRGAWTAQILEEMRKSILRSGRAAPDQIDRTVRLMREHCPEFMVDGYEDLIPAMTNQQKDRHVLAAAVRASADTIVTYNLKDFPLRAREKYDIDLHSPDEFLLDLWLADANRMARMLVHMAAGLKKPPLTAPELVRGLGRHAPTFAEEVLSSGNIELAEHAEREGVPLPHYRLL